ncbi:uncharacterized protein LOC135135231 [Zophobas morio]|uniref:uncharacterized protein LOC135135231 n=1 Tax=Zophobas morio TaxID=2755281 RepID=UPI003082DCA0
MPGCCVPLCGNKSRLFRLPTGVSNRARREMWENLIGRDDLNDNSRICELHFSEQQFEAKRADGRKLLRPNAVPDVLNKNVGACVSMDDCTPLTTARENEIFELESCSNNENVNVGCFPEVDSLLDQTNIVEEFQTLIENLRNALRKALRERNKYKKALENCVNNLQGTLNEDQIQFIQTGTARGQLWSEDTMTKALKLYLACGAKGYEEIRRQKLPYPSIRTIQQRLQGITLKHK